LALFLICLGEFQVAQVAIAAQIEHVRVSRVNLKWKQSGKSFGYMSLFQICSTDLGGQGFATSVGNATNDDDDADDFPFGKGKLCLQV